MDKVKPFASTKFTQTGILSAVQYIKQTTPSPPPSLSLLLTRSLSPLLSFPPIFLRVSPRLFVAPQSRGLCRRFPRSICGIRHGSLGPSQWRAVTCPMGVLEGEPKRFGDGGSTARGALTSPSRKKKSPSRGNCKST